MKFRHFIGVLVMTCMLSGCSALGVMTNKQKDIELNENIDGSQVYRYIKSFEVMDSAELRGQIINETEDGTSVVDFACVKDGKKQLSYLKSNDVVAWAEYSDGSNKYALNIDDKVYSKLDNLTLNIYGDLDDLFVNAVSYEAYGNKEVVHIYNSEFMIDSYITCSYNEQGVVLDITDNNSESTGRLFTVQVSSLKDEDKQLLSLVGYTEAEESIVSKGEG